MSIRRINDKVLSLIDDLEELKEILQSRIHYNVDIAAAVDSCETHQETLDGLIDFLTDTNNIMDYKEDMSDDLEEYEDEY